MFTGIVTHRGRLASRCQDTPETGARIRISCPQEAAPGRVGDSVAVQGVCLTAVRILDVVEEAAFEADLSPETLRRTTAAAWSPGQALNLERPLRVGDELGGHFVSGHVDAAGDILSIEPEGDGRRFCIQAPAHLAHLIAEKGSVAVDGVSLTVAAVEGNRFEASLIPHTLAVTTLGAARTGDRVNLEADPVARHVARLRKFEND